MLTESEAILSHIAYKKKNSPLLGNNANKRSKIHQYLFFAESPISPTIVPTSMPYFSYVSYDKKVETKAYQLLDRSLSYLNIELKDKTYLVGNHFTLADTNLYFCLETLCFLFISSQDQLKYYSLSKWMNYIGNIKKVKEIGDIKY